MTEGISAPFSGSSRPSGGLRTHEYVEIFQRLASALPAPSELVVTLSGDRGPAPSELVAAAPQLRVGEGGRVEIFQRLASALPAPSELVVTLSGDRGPLTCPPYVRAPHSARCASALGVDAFPPSIGAPYPSIGHYRDSTLSRGNTNRGTRFFRRHAGS